MAYVPQPRIKAFAYYLPFPFTVATLSLGRDIDASNVLGLVILNVYIHGVRLLHRELHVPIVVSIALAAAGYSVIGYLLAPVVPSGDVPFWLALTGVALLAGVLYRRLPHREELGHRTALPVWVKLPIVAAVVILLVVVKQHLGGFMTLFPMVGVVGAYEARYSLWALARQLPTWMLAMIPFLAVVRLSQGWLGLGGALALGWVVFLAALGPLTRRQWRRRTA